jgi:hypothetical protein
MSSALTEATVSALRGEGAYLGGGGKVTPYTPKRRGLSAKSKR